MGYLFQINKMLVEIKKNTSGDTGANKILVEDCIERTPHIGEDNSFDMILFFCKELNIIKEKDSRLTVTSVGDDIINFMPLVNNARQIDPNDEQKEILIDLFSKTEFKKKLKQIFDSAKKDYIKKPTVFYFTKSQFHTYGDELIFLLELGFIVERKLRYEILDKYNSVFMSCITNFSKEELIELQKAQDKVGKRGEELSIESEKNRLKGAGREDLAILVSDVSDDLTLGYDIASFNENNEDYKFDRKIEAKASSTEKRFFWSEGEVEAAEKFGENFWIYFWFDVWSEEPILTRIQDPFKKIRKNKEFVEEPMKWRVKIESD
tara:strand:- start:343 stop:1305 length:963 start_codon:yes stop_codon:yes gene_type:complete